MEARGRGGGEGRVGGRDVEGKVTGMGLGEARVGEGI